MRKAFLTFGKFLKDLDFNTILYNKKSMKVKHDYKTKPLYLSEKGLLDKIVSGTSLSTMTQRFSDIAYVLC